MKIVIYGRPGCPYCARALEESKNLKANNLADYEYIDVYEQNISKDELSQKLNKEVKTWPQVLVDDNYIGGCDNFLEFLSQR
ncbi:MAG: GrxA family glutaredoxin [Psittacicella sp.]